MDPKAITCMFLGYSATWKGYCCYDPISRRRFVSVDVIFFVSVPYFSAAMHSQEGESASRDSYEVPLLVTIITVELHVLIVSVPLKGESCRIIVSINTNGLQQKPQPIYPLQGAQQSLSTAGPISLPYSR